MLIVAALICGLVFSRGLLISGMGATWQSSRISRHFWALGPEPRRRDGGSVGRFRRGVRASEKTRRATAYGREFLATKTDIDRYLVIGSVLFGIGWGLVGLCPGPALVNLASGSPWIIVFVIAMAAGMALNDFWQKRRLTIKTVATAADGQ
jgi:uncharacterized membrane protein YedE/YeeE